MTSKAGGKGEGKREGSDRQGGGVERASTLPSECPRRATLADEVAEKQTTASFTLPADRRTFGSQADGHRSKGERPRGHSGGRADRLTFLVAG